MNSSCAEFVIEIDQWLERNHGSDVDRATLAAIKLSAGKKVLTHLEDVAARTTRASARVSAYALAEWFAHNWWRLRYETDRESDFDWKSSHHLPNAGNGFLWPDVTFHFDGRMIVVTSKPVTYDGVVDYLTPCSMPIAPESFEKAVGNFIEQVLSRLAALNLQTELSQLWAEVGAEKRDANAVIYRRLEAISGRDPDEADPAFVDFLQKASASHGQGAIEEILSEYGTESKAKLEELLEVRKDAKSARVERVESIAAIIQSSPHQHPWECAEAVASELRKAWNVPLPVTNETICGLLQLEFDWLDTGNGGVQRSVIAGFRDPCSDAALKVVLSSRHANQRRFQLFRIVGDHLIAPASDNLLPALSNHATYRQKFQRAFAAAFLCPYESLREFLPPGVPSDDDIEDAAHHFNVSSLVVQTTLVNKYDLSKSVLHTAR